MRRVLTLTEAHEIHIDLKDLDLLKGMCIRELRISVRRPGSWRQGSVARMQQTFASSLISYVAWLQNEAVRSTSAMDEKKQGKSFFLEIERRKERDKRRISFILIDIEKMKGVLRKSCF